MERTDDAARTGRAPSAPLLVTGVFFTIVGCLDMPAPPPSDPPRLAQTQTNARPVASTRPLAAVAGMFRPGATPFYATDLGWTFAHEGQLWVMFGDTWSSFLGDGIRPDADDVLAKIPLRAFPSGDMVELWAAMHPAPRGMPRWQASGPPLQIAVDEPGLPRPIRTVRDGQPLTSGPGLTPIAGFSNARRGDDSGAFGLFLRNQPVPCDADATCRDGFACDRDVGKCAPIEDDLSPTCVLGTASCWCIRIAPGLCQDRAPSIYDESERGRSHAVVMRHEIGNALHDDHTQFVSRAWDTRRFFNATARTVRDFDPERPAGEGNDYTPADGTTPNSDGVLLWGRPNFGGVRALGRDAQLYLAWVPMPLYDAAGAFDWRPRFFAGLSADGRPQFVDREVDAVPLDLDADTPGDQPTELRDLVGQMTISFLPTLRRFVMIYGGGIGSYFTEKIFGPDAAKMALDPAGALYVRYAEHPWGPWTAPEPLLAAGNPNAGVLGEYGPGGLLHHEGCVEPSCVPGEFAYFGPERGQLYAPGIIDAWTTPRPGGSVDLYWHVSTWNPYQVVLMKTRLGRPGD